MPFRTTPFVNDQFYHLFNRGVNKQPIFSNDSDYRRFLEIIAYYMFSGPKPSFSQHQRFQIKSFQSNPKIVEIISYCLMSNHFHFLIRQLQDGGIHEFMRKACNSYVKYYNTKHKRVGPLFQAEFKAVMIENDDQLMHLSRYIHLNPYVGGLTKDVSSFPYSSYRTFVGTENNKLCNTKPVLSLFSSKEDYKNFVHDQKDYAIQLEQLKHLLHEE